MCVTSKPLHRVAQVGFTLVELMIGLTLGLIVLGSLVAFTTSMVRSNTESVRLTRLTEDLRTGMNLVTREVRRSGFDSESVNSALTSSAPTAYADLVVQEAPGCVVYEYDLGDASKEFRGFKLDSASGTLSMKVASSAVTCASSDGWSPISNPDVVRITKFTPRLFQTRFCGELGEYTSKADGKTYAVLAKGRVRTLALCVKGELRSDASISRHLTDVMRLRTEGLQFFDTEPVGTKCTAAERASDLIIAVDEWNKECAGT